ncbi:uncharacterized protein LOC135394753 [Ornithodoros turicata]|uniref:uncharacterized protein LOC135394753 n=1 Tax=Ornithodoros turicata TaxID=34597 RepID=UPI003138BCAB
MKIKVEKSHGDSVYASNETSGRVGVGQTGNAGTSFPHKVKQEPREQPESGRAVERKWYSNGPLASPVRSGRRNAVKRERSPKFDTSVQPSRAQEQNYQLPIPVHVGTVGSSSQQQSAHHAANRSVEYGMRMHAGHGPWRRNHQVWRPPHANRWERPCPPPSFSGPPQFIGNMQDPGAFRKPKKKKKRRQNRPAQPAMSRGVPRFAGTSASGTRSLTNETTSRQPSWQNESSDKKSLKTEMDVKEELAEPGPSSDVAADAQTVGEGPPKKKMKQGVTSSRPLTSQDVREKALERLRAAQFRLLNEEMYLTSGSQAEQAFKEDPQAFKYYHAGFQKQVAKWPVNPVDVIIADLKKLPKVTVIADMGCGNAKISESLQKRKVHSFDLVALNDRVTQCDMSNVPLDSSSVDVVVFCLSLMGTNLNSFILEANRILKTEGALKIAEVESRFNSVDGFVDALKKFGFVLKSQNGSYKMFILFDFKKTQAVKENPGLPTLELKPCLYKKR